MKPDKVTPKNLLKDISVTAKFDKCSQSTFVIASPTPANTLTLVADDLATPLLSAVADWYTKGILLYDFVTGECPTGKCPDAPKKITSDNLTRLLWKSTKKVGFGIRGAEVVAWFCDAKMPALTIGNAGSKTAAKANVGKTCIETPELNDSCFSTSALTAINLKRKDHGSPKVKESPTSAGELQKLLNGYNAKQLASDKAAMTALLTKSGVRSGCTMDIYEYIGASTDNMIMLKTTDLAVNSWYNKKIYYDFKTGQPKYAKTDDKKMKAFKKAQSDEFTALIWKKSTTTLFGIKGKWAVVWLCPGGNKPTDTQQTYVDNVSDKCIKDGYNRCYNEMALKYHNEMRVQHI